MNWSFVLKSLYTVSQDKKPRDYPTSGDPRDGVTGRRDPGPTTGLTNGLPLDLGLVSTLLLPPRAGGASPFSREVRPGDAPPEKVHGPPVVDGFLGRLVPVSGDRSPPFTATETPRTGHGRSHPAPNPSTDSSTDWKRDPSSSVPSTSPTSTSSTSYETRS